MPLPIRESVRDSIREMFIGRGDSMYAGEPVTQTQHALQCAHFAEQAAAPLRLIVSALLHDVGHLLHDLGEDCADHGIDDRHEDRGAVWLVEHFPDEVVEPVRLHVAAKRYRCAIDPEYLSQLSGASVLSLKLQGGPMSPEEQQAFREHPQWRDALRLRMWDEAAKDPELLVAPLAHYLDIVDKYLNSV
jgi:[1-hydroxy-2-(trimethylamino)ethyl]phosphonate dioxygenase